MALHIENYLRANRLEMVSFKRIRANINADYSDERLRSLIDLNPTRFRATLLSGDRPGIGLARQPEALNRLMMASPSAQQSIPRRAKQRVPA